MPPRDLNGEAVASPLIIAFLHKNYIRFQTFLSGYPGFFVKGAFLAPFAKFLEFQLPFHFLLVFCGIVIRPLTNGAF